MKPLFLLSFLLLLGCFNDGEPYTESGWMATELLIIKENNDSIFKTYDSLLHIAGQIKANNDKLIKENDSLKNVIKNSKKIKP